jgi:hypothetical protein
LLFGTSIENSGGLTLWDYAKDISIKRVKQSRYRPGVAQRVPGS